MNLNEAESPSRGQEIRDLVRDLEDATQLSSRGRASKRVCDVYGSDEKVVSWKFQEWDYGKNNIKLPCQARGLFILDDENPEIVARGYDKFFNIDEVPFTRWERIKTDTVGPYDVTLKSNGCIIFISGLADGTLVVCSKHSTGPRMDVDRNHAESGQKYLTNQLSKLGICAKDFAKTLHTLNVTAVAEYCDDSFEEHILAYEGDQVGLYLHGVNVNQRDFATWPIEEVAKFAFRYGFKPTEYHKVKDLNDLQKFLHECSQHGGYDGKEAEGFVIRCRLKENGRDFFFKYKFEEPYLMYRQWREVTKDYITTRSRVFKFKKHKFITNKYLDFVIPLLEGDKELCDRYLKGFGIIKLRNDFLKSYGMSGMEILNYERVKELELRNSLNFDVVDEKTKFLIIPIAVIGCGKTTTALTLKNLYPSSWAVVQNDDITSKDRSMLMKKSLEFLADPKIKCVFVDRNNHQYRERKELFTWLEQLKENYLPYDTNIKVIGLSFFSYKDLEIVKNLTINRVLTRGDNHQSIKSSSYGEKKVLGIMQGFMNRFQPVIEEKAPDSMFDLIIHLNVSDENSSLSNATAVLQRLHETFPVLVPTIPTTDKVEEAFQKSLNYKPTITKIVKGNGGGSSKKCSPTFFSAHVNDRLAIMEEISKLVRDSELDVNGRSEINKLFQENGFQQEFHITLAHIKQCKKGTELQKATWKSLVSRYQDLISGVKVLSKQRQAVLTGDTVKFTMQKLCWDEKAAGVVVSFPELFIFDPEGQPIPNINPCNEISHITVGILKPGTPPYYTNELCRKALSSEGNYHVLDFHKQKTFEGTVCLTFQ